MPRRRGISLLEVLFAIGVVAVGLLGVMAVVPVALDQVGQGQVADASARAGLNALREFNSRGMARADQWLQFHAQPRPDRWDIVTWSKGADGQWGGPGDDDQDGTAGNVDEAGWRQNATDPATAFDLEGDYPIAGLSYVIDPRFLAVPDNLPILGGNGGQFPYRNQALTGNERSLLKMKRITLRRNQSAMRPFLPMTAVQANKVFQIDDDLVFDIPDEVENPPQQVYTWSPGPDGEWGVANTNDDQLGPTDDVQERGWPGSDDIPIIRQSDGAFSWMATLVPRRDQVGEISDRYQLSIVVFHRRDPLLTQNSENERVAYIRTGTPSQTDFHSFGLSGGDITLRAYRNAPSPSVDLDVSAGDWVILAAPMVHASRGSINYFRWYRVVATDESRQINPGEWIRDITLDGPDWPIDSIIAPPALNGEKDHTRVILPRNVVAVLDEEVIIETD